MTVLHMPKLHVGQGSGFGGLTVFPVWVDAPAVGGIDVGTAAHLDVSERQGSPVVGELIVRNDGHRPALLLEGELLEGGWQNRALNYSLLLAPAMSEVVNVSCVERRRWGGNVEHSNHARSASASVKAGLRNTECASQGDVWARVERMEDQLGESETSSLTAHLDRIGAEHDPLDKIHRLPGQRGVVVGIGGVPAYLEIYPNTRALAAHWHGLLTAAALDARLAPQVRTLGGAARDFAATVERMVLKPDRSAGIGRIVLSNRPGVSLRGISLDKKLVHASAFHDAHPLMAAV